MGNVKYFPIYDIHTAAYLNYKGILLNLTKEGTRVVFEVPNAEQTYLMLRDYQSNPLVPLLDFVAVLRRLRAKMLEARDGNEKRGRETKNGHPSSL